MGFGLRLVSVNTINSHENGKKNSHVAWLIHMTEVVIKIRKRCRSKLMGLLGSCGDWAIEFSVSDEGERRKLQASLGSFNELATKNL